MPDWRDAAAYAPLLGADRSLFAWEWLRRDRSYCVAARHALERGAGGRGEDAAAAAFGLVAFEAPRLGVPHARPLWRSDASPYVLALDACRTMRGRDRLDLQRLGSLVRVLARDGIGHLLLSDGLRVIRLDAPEAVLAGGPFCPRFILCGLASAEPALLTLRRLLALCRTGRLSGSLHRSERKARRWILMLRASDALSAGADQREIAGELLSRAATEPRWRSSQPSIRSQVQRLVRAARSMAGGGYPRLLQP